MALKNYLLLAMTAITMISMVAKADREHQPGRDGGYGGHHGGHQGGGPVPGAPGPGRGPGYRQEQKIIYLGRRVVNETLHLRRLANINQNYAGFAVDSVEIQIAGVAYNSDISLITDGRVEQTVFAQPGRVLLRPRFGAVLERDIRTLQLNVRGMIDIQSIVINLRDGGGFGYPGGPQQPRNPNMGRMDLPINIYRRMIGNDRLDLNQYVDLFAYRGYKVEEMIIEATPVFNAALLDVLVDRFNLGQTLQVDRYSSQFIIRPFNLVLGQGGGIISMISRGDLDLHRVTLRLVRY